MVSMNMLLQGAKTIASLPYKFDNPLCTMNEYAVQNCCDQSTKRVATLGKMILYCKHFGKSFNQQCCNILISRGYYNRKYAR